MLLAIGVVGVIICLASVVLLGLDISRYITAGILSSKFHMTTILELMRVWTPDLWTQTVNDINNRAQGEFWPAAVHFGVSIPATVIGLLLGVILVVIGFRIRRYRY